MYERVGGGYDAVVEEEGREKGVKGDGRKEGGREGGRNNSLKLNRLLPNPPLLLIPPQRIIQQHPTPLRNVNRLVSRLLTKFGDLVFFQRALEEFGEGFDGLFEVAVEGVDGEHEEKQGKGGREGEGQTNFWLSSNIWVWLFFSR
jgi:hypothetical protein